LAPPTLPLLEHPPSIIEKSPILLMRDLAQRLRIEVSRTEVVDEALNNPDRLGRLAGTADPGFAG